MSDAEVKIPVEAETEGKASTAVTKPVGDTAEGEDKGNTHVVVITVPSVTAEARAVLKPVGDTAAEAQLKEEAAEWISQQRKFLMIVAVVVAISTFRAGISQKGFWPDSRDGHLAGESIFLSVYPRSHSYFMLCNGVSFFTSVLMLLCLAHDRLYGTPMKMAVLNIIGMVDLGLLVPVFIFGAFPEKPSDGLWCVLYALTICGTIFLAVHLVRAPWKDAEKQPRKKAKRAKRI